jgi:ribonucleoside-diphosphate reductase alpha chain
MSIKAMQNYTFTSKYAKYLPEQMRRETWSEAVDRVKNMHLEFYKDKDQDVIDDINWAFDQYKKKLVLGSQRALQFGGLPILKKNERIYNCSFTYVDRPRVFQEVMYLLLCGCGVGFSVQKCHIDKLPRIVSEFSGSKKFVIPDTIEGWSDAIGALVCSYFEDNTEWDEYKGKNITFDYTKIRPAGYPLSYGGKAPGPEGLKKAISNIKKILDNAFKNSEFAKKQLKPIECYDILMHAADAVISGGVRRSATIALFSKNDKEMLTAKTGNWFNENPQRGRSNNSVLLVRDETTKEDFTQIIESTKQFGEPGFVFANSEAEGFNPCAEISFVPFDEITNKSGVQFCNLTEINGKKIKDVETFEIACRASAIIGTLQAGYTNFPYLTQATKNITEKEALLGCSITGIMENPEILLDPKTQRNMAKLIKRVNKDLSEKLGINPAARATCVKPAGTTSCILGSSSGIHPHHAKRYIRRIQANKLENVYQFFKQFNPRACEESVWSANENDDVISFCVEVPDGAKIKNQLGAIDLLEAVKITQQNWVEYGTNPELSIDKNLRHNVSNTINVKADEWQDITDYIYKNRKHFAGISLLSITGDKDYPQAPFTAIYLPSEMQHHYGDGVMFVSGLIEQALQLFDDNLWSACDCLTGLIKPKGQAKKDWIERCKRFSEKYNGGDIKKLSYCMKDVYNYKTWLDLNREYAEVEYVKLIEDQDNTKVQETVACAGGSCEII